MKKHEGKTKTKIWIISTFILLLFIINSIYNIYLERLEINRKLTKLSSLYQKITVDANNVNEDYCSNRDDIIFEIRKLIENTEIIGFGAYNNSICIHTIINVDKDRFDSKKQDILREYNTLLESDKLSEFQDQLSQAAFAEYKIYQIEFYLNIYKNLTINFETYNEINWKLEQLAEEFRISSQRSADY